MFLGRNLLRSCWRCADKPLAGSVKQNVLAIPTLTFYSHTRVPVEAVCVTVQLQLERELKERSRVVDQ